MVKMKKILLLILIPILLLTTIIVLDNDVYAVNDDRPIDEVIVANVEYNDGAVILSPSPAYVRSDIYDNDTVVRVLYIASFNRIVDIKIDASSGDNIYYDVGMLTVVYEYDDPHEYYAYVSLYDINGNIILDTMYDIQLTLYFSFQIGEALDGVSYIDGYNDGYDDGYNDGYDDGLDEGYNDGYNKGYDDARDEYGEYLTVDNLFNLPQGWYGFDTGYNYGLNEGYNEGYDDGYDYGEAIGYQLGLNETDATGFTALLITVFSGLGGLLAIEILPNISIGAIIAVPLVFGIIAFILGKRKGGD